MSIKKYVRALVEIYSVDELATTYNALKNIIELEKNEKYSLIITSPILTNEQKVAFLSDVLKISDNKLINLLKLLSENNRLQELPKLVFLLKDTIATLSGKYEGFVYTKDPISDEKVKEIASKLSKKFDKTITLVQKSSDRDGIQVYVDSLNVEIAVYEEDIKAKLIKNIIRAI